MTIAYLYHKASFSRDQSFSSDDWRIFGDIVADKLAASIYYPQLLMG